MKQFNTVEDEAAAFGDLDKVDLCYDYYPNQYGGREGSMVSFGFRILLAELPLHLGKTLDAMDRLYALLTKVEQLLQKGKYIFYTRWGKTPFYTRNWTF